MVFTIFGTQTHLRLHTHEQTDNAQTYYAFTAMAAEAWKYVQHENLYGY